MNGATSKSETLNSELLKQRNIKSEIGNSARLVSITLNTATWRRKTSNSEH